jgi:serine/threonine-protein kinase
VLSGAYRVDRILREGGTGVTVAATDLRRAQPVSIRILRRELLGPREAVERLVRDAHAASRLRGDHVLPTRDVGFTEAGAPFVVTDLLAGEDLESVLAARGPLPVGVAVDAVLQACEVVAEAHAHGLVHRNLKPANLFLTTTARPTRALKVQGFGAATTGSPAYMSPEQVHGAAVDARSDVWSLAVTLWELVSGEVPFRGRNFTEICLRIAMDPVPPAPRGMPLALAAVLRRALEKDPRRRFASAGELAAALAPFATRPSDASTYDTLDRAVGERVARRPAERPPSRRLLGVAIGAAAATVALVGLLFVAPPGRGEAPVAASRPAAADAGPADAPPR